MTAIETLTHKDETYCRAAYPDGLVVWSNRRASFSVRPCEVPLVLSNVLRLPIEVNPGAPIANLLSRLVEASDFKVLEVGPQGLAVIPYLAEVAKVPPVGISLVDYTNLKRVAEAAVALEGATLVRNTALGLADKFSTITGQKVRWMQESVETAIEGLGRQEAKFDAIVAPSGLPAWLNLNSLLEKGGSIIYKQQVGRE